VLTVLKDSGTSMSLADLAAATGVPRASAGAYLAKMVNAGKVVRTEPGRFLYPDNQLIEEPQQKAEIR
jgi:DNA-binding IclR family transcriptional regulator